MVQACLLNLDAASRLRARGYDPECVVEQYRNEGYVIIDGMLSSDRASPLHLDSLRRCAETAAQLTRDGRWPHRRVVGNAFPPFTNHNADSWGVQHIMNPQLDSLSPASESLASTFQQLYASAVLLDVASLLMGVQVHEMQMELFNLLINPSSHSFALGWHRDDIKHDVSVSEEECRLATPTYGVQFNTALYDDNCLLIVPTTHRRTRNAAEIVANNAKPPAATLITTNSACQRQQPESFSPDGTWIGVDPPNTLRVHLKPGETAFYSQRILHRASYLPHVKRATLHGCFGDASQGGRGAHERARNVLQHGVEWMRDAQFGDGLPECLKPMWANLLRMDAAYADRQLGFSLDND